MKYTLLSVLEHLPYFTIDGFRQIAGDAAVDDARARIALSRWVKAGHLIALKKGVYMHRRFYELHRQETSFAPVVSAILLPRSYLSLEYVLQQSGILTEITYLVTAITSKNTRTFVNHLGTFVYRHIQPDLYFGFQIMDAYSMPYVQASVAKALFDYLYLRPLLANLDPEHYNLAEELRLNLEEFTREEQDEFAGFVLKSESTRRGGAKMQRILKNLEAHVWRR
jgi:predicted transcriptional regulator of viral defense system